jgi:hypothetical protein
MSATVTLTGTAGAGLTVTALQFTSVDWFTIDTNANMITMYRNGAVVPPISISAATTVTATKSGTTWTLIIS